MSNGAGGLGHPRDPEKEFNGCLIAVAIGVGILLLIGLLADWLAG